MKIAFEAPLFDQHDAHIRLHFSHHGDGDNWISGSPRTLAEQMLTSEAKVKRSLAKLTQAGILEQKDPQLPTLQKPHMYRITV